MALPGLEKIRAIERDLARGKIFPPLILVGRDITRPAENLVVLEGHARITAYLLRLDLVPMPLEVIVGFSAEISRWVFY